MPKKEFETKEHSVHTVNLAITTHYLQIWNKMNDKNESLLASCWYMCFGVDIQHDMYVWVLHVDSCARLVSLLSLLLPRLVLLCVSPFEAKLGIRPLGKVLSVAPSADNNCSSSLAGKLSRGCELSSWITDIQNTVQTKHMSNIYNEEKLKCLRG